MTVSAPISRAGAPAPSADLAERAMGATVADVVRRFPVEVTWQTPLEDVCTMLTTRALDAAPVVDDDLRVVGVVTKAAILRHVREGTIEMDRRASLSAAQELVTPAAALLRPDTPLSLAIAAFAFHEAQDLPVVAADGTCKGVLCSRDLLRWLARELGYAVPEPGA